MVMNTFSATPREQTHPAFHDRGRGQAQDDDEQADAEQGQPRAEHQRASGQVNAGCKPDGGQREQRHGHRRPRRIAKAQVAHNPGDDQHDRPRSN
jgi:hypothetical protein